MEKRERKRRLPSQPDPKWSRLTNRETIDRDAYRSPVADNRLQVTKENELPHIGNEIKEIIFPPPFTHRKMTRRLLNLDEIQWNRDSGSRPPESSESCWLLDRQPESSASSGWWRQVEKKKETKTNDRWNDAMGGWKLCYCEFQTPQGVPIPAAISIGGSVEREVERGSEIIRVYKRKERRRRRRRKGDSHYEKTTAEWNRKFFITPL